LTATGAALLPEARALLEQAERASAIAARVQKGELGELRVGFTSSSALTRPIPSLIYAYRQRWPGVRLRIEELTTNEQLAALLERRLDVAFVRAPKAPDLPPSLHAVRLFEDALVVALPPQHRLAGDAGAVSVSALADEDFVMYPRESGTGVYDQIMALCYRAGFVPRVAQEARMVATMVGLVAAGLGIALVPESLRNIDVNGTVYRPLREKEAKSAMWMVLRTGNVSAQEKGFLELVKEGPPGPERPGRLLAEREKA